MSEKVQLAIRNTARSEAMAIVDSLADWLKDEVSLKIGIGETEVDKPAPVDPSRLNGRLDSMSIGEALSLADEVEGRTEAKLEEARERIRHARDFLMSLVNAGIDILTVGALASLGGRR